MADEQTAIGMINHPGRGIDRLWISFIDDGIVQDQIIFRRKLGEPLPGGATVMALVEPAIGRSKVEMPAVRRVRSKAARIPSVRAYGNPRAGRGIRIGCHLRWQSKKRKRRGREQEERCETAIHRTELPLEGDC